MDINTLKEERRRRLEPLERNLMESRAPEDGLFYYHSSEDRIVLSHAIFLIMTKSLRGKIAKQEFLLLLRQYEEEMLSAYLTEDDYYKELLRYCNVIYETMPIILNGQFSLSTDKEARKFAVISYIAAGYAGDMPEELCDDLLDDMDFLYNKVKCRKIEQMLPLLNRMVEEEMKEFMR